MSALLTNEQIDAIGQRHLPDPEWPDSDDADYTALLSHARAANERIAELEASNVALSERIKQDAEDMREVAGLLMQAVNMGAPGTYT